MRFGMGVPTATEGMMYPVPFAGIDDAVRLGEAAEALGFDSVWGNDHVSTQSYVRAEFDEPPRFYEPLEYLAYLAASTSRVRLATCILVLPFRHPVMAAKQIATLDRLSGGRAVVGVGVGAYREEFEAMWPGRKLNRGEYVQESLESMRLLFTQRRASYDGKWVQFADVESFPKPLQEPLPVLSGGNAPGSRRRAAQLGQGWLPACLTPEQVSAGRAEIGSIAAEHGRDLPDDFEVALQVAVSMAATHEEAVERFRSSQVYAHLKSLSQSTLKDQREDETFEDRNLIGTPDEIIERIVAYEQAGVDTLAGLLFATNEVQETIEVMDQFSDKVIAQVSSSTDHVEVRHG
jgi:probable F420-dependent oxidoreductase